MAFKIEELYLGDESYKEQTRARKVFEALVKSAHAGERLTEHEKEFLFMALSLSQANDGRPEQFRQCDNPKFKWLFLTYFDDITGGRRFYKPSIGKGQHPTGRLRVVPPSEAQADLDYLIEKAEEFDLLILNNASDQLLQETIVETRRELKNLDKQPEFTSDPYFSGCFFYRYRRWALLMRYKYLYHYAQEIFETNDNKPYVFEVNGEVVELTEYSLIHILSRHFAQVMTQYPTGKSYHKDIFRPRIMGEQLKAIFKKVAVHYKMQRIDKVFFSFQGCVYAMWIADRIKHIKGKQIAYKRLETLYPVEEIRELNQIQNDYRPVQITNEIIIYEEI